MWKHYWIFYPITAWKKISIYILVSFISNERSFLASKFFVIWIIVLLILHSKETIKNITFFHTTSFELKKIQVWFSQRKFIELEHHALFDRWISARSLFSRDRDRDRNRFLSHSPPLPFPARHGAEPILAGATRAHTHARFSKLSWTKCHERFLSWPHGAPVCEV